LDFLSWICRSLHLLGGIIWLGGLIFQQLVLIPVSKIEHNLSISVIRKMSAQYQKIQWLGIIIVVTSGVYMITRHTNYIWFQFYDRWSVFVGFKQLIFILMFFYAYGSFKMSKYIESPSSNGGYDKKTEVFRNRINQFRTTSIILGIMALFLGTAMAIYA